MRNQTMQGGMRTHYVIAVVAVIGLGIGAKQFFFPPVKAEANLRAVVGKPTIDIGALMTTTDVKALARQEIPSQVYE